MVVTTHYLWQSQTNHVIALRKCGPYILCFRRWSVDAYPFPHQFSMPNSDHATEEPPGLPVLQHRMPGLSFSSNCLSRVHCVRSPSDPGSCEVYTLSALAEDHRRGTFHFQVHVHAAPEPALSVRFLGVDGTHADGRVASWDLGASGWRGAWVLRPNTCGKRRVIAFTAPLPQDQNQNQNQNTYASDPFLAPVSPDSDGGALDVPPDAPRFEKNVVWTVSSLKSDGKWCFAFLGGYVVIT